MEWGCEN